MQLVSMSAVTWDFPLRGRTRMLTESWLRRGQATTFVQVPSHRSALERLLRRREDAPVVRPWPIQPARRWPAVGEVALRRRAAKRARELRRQLDRPVSWDSAVALVVSPIWTPWLEYLPFRTVVYDCIDDLSVHVPDRRLLPIVSRWEEELVARANGAIVSAGVLGAAIRARRADLPLATVHNGVDAEAFRDAARREARPADLPKPGGAPLVGFVGALYDWIDWPLVAQGVAALPGIDFAIVGPSSRRPRELRELVPSANAVFLGPRPFARVPAYVNAFDVCWVPFRRDAVGLSANPVKIYEYLALGRPVVSTPVADPKSFEGLVTFGSGSDEIVAALRAAVAGVAGRDREPVDRAARERFADANSWDARAADVARFAHSLA